METQTQTTRRLTREEGMAARLLGRTEEACPYPWEGLRKDRSCGTYIRPHSGGYEYGRWWHGLFGDYRFEKLGDEPTVEACKLGFELVDKAVDRRATQLNKRQRRRA